MAVPRPRGSSAPTRNGSSPGRCAGFLVLPSERKMNMKAKQVKGRPLSPDLLRKMDAYWRAGHYFFVGHIFFFDNPLLRVPPPTRHIKTPPLGPQGTAPRVNLPYYPLNRII